MSTNRLSFFNHLAHTQTDGHCYDPRLTSFIIGRNTDAIAPHLCFENHTADIKDLSRDKHCVLRNAIGSHVYDKPILLSMHLADSPTPETTPPHLPTRLCVVRCLANHFETLTLYQRNKHLPISSLEDVLSHAQTLTRSALIISTFLHGLSDVMLQKAQDILTHKSPEPAPYLFAPQC